MALSALSRLRAPGLRGLRRALTGAALTAVAVAASACCNPAKAPGRCTACVYDNCIVPTLASTGLPAPSADVLPVADHDTREAGASATAMAY